MYVTGGFRLTDRPRMTRRDDSLIGQVVAANVLLVALTLLAASLVAGLDLQVAERALAVPGARPRDHAHPLREHVDAPAPLPAAGAPHRAHRAGGSRRSPVHAGAAASDKPAEEIGRLAESFRRLLERVEQERRRSGQLVMRAQEEERRRLARDLHDEVNQALTAILLRLEALAQDSPPAARAGGGRAEAPREPGDGRAAQPRPPASPHGARRPRPRAGDRRPAEALLGADRRRGADATPRGRRRARGGRADRGLPGGAGGAHQRRAPRRRHLRRGRARGPRTRPSCASATTAAASTGPGRPALGERQRSLGLRGHGRARPAGGRRARRALRPRRRHLRDPEDADDPRPHRRRPRDRALRTEDAHRPPGGHAGVAEAEDGVGAVDGPGASVRTWPCSTCRCPA